MSGVSMGDYWMGRDVSHASELTAQIRANAAVTVGRANDLLVEYRYQTEDTRLIAVNSGWRPAAINAATKGAAKASRHMTGEAIDLADTRGTLDAWCVCAEGLRTLERVGLWLEHPSATPGWCHLQIVPPRSGRRVFYPFPTAANVRAVIGGDRG